MKKNIFVMAMAGAAVLAGCQKEVSSVAPDHNGIVITALSDNEPDAKTTLEGKQVLWNNSDAIAVSNGSAVAEFTTADPDGSASASFTTSSDTFEEAETYSALYPYAEGTVFADGKVNAEVPAIQAPVAGSFAKGVNVAVAQGAGDALSFKNVCAYLKFTVPAGMTDLKKVELVANGGEKLSGKISVNVADASYTLTSAEESSSVSLAGTFEAGKSYYVAVLPQTLSAGFTLTMTRGEKESTMETDKEFTFTRSRTANIGELYDGTWKVSLEGTAVPEGKSIILTQTLENENLFACLEDLKAGELRLKVLYENVYIATEGGNFNDGEAMTYSTSSSECVFTIPSDDRYRIVLDKETSKITFTSSDKDVKNKTVVFKRTTVTPNILYYSMEVTKLWLFGGSSYCGGKDNSQPKGDPYTLTQSLANPRLFVYKGEKLTVDNIKFLISDNWNNEYAFGSGNEKNSVKKPNSGQKYTPIYGGQGNNRYALFTIPANTNYIEVYIGAPSADEVYGEGQSAAGNTYEINGSYVIFANR